MYVCIEVSVHLYMIIHVGKFIYVSVFIHPYVHKYFLQLIEILYYVFGKGMLKTLIFLIFLEFYIQN